MPIGTRLIEFDPGGDDDVHLPAHHRRGGEVERLLAAAALAVDAGAGDAFGQARRQDGIARDIARLLRELADAAHDDVLDQRRVGVSAVDERIQHLPREIGGMPPGQPSAAAASRSTRGGDDIGGFHGTLSPEDGPVCPGLDARATPRHSQCTDPRGRR